MKSFQIILMTVVVSVLASYATVKLLAKNTPVAVVQKQESAFERVVRTGIVRCGYAISPPVMVKDANTGKVSGMDVDIWEAIGRQLGLKIEWTEEAGWGNFIEGLKAKRYDAFCSELWPDEARSKYLSLSLPVTYSILKTYVRADDHRFDGNADAINSPEVTIPVIDGDVSATMAKTGYPNAKVLSLPQTATVSDIFMSIVSKKGDVFFFEPAMFDEFEKTNKGQIREVTDIPPSFVFASYYGYDVHETQLRDMVDIALRSLIDGGGLQKITLKYSKDYHVPKQNF